MASSAIPAPGPRARSRLRWTSTDLRAGRGPVAGLVLALALLLVLLGMTWVDAARLGHDQDHVDRAHRVLRGLDTVLAHVTSAEAGRRGFLADQDAGLAAATAGEKAIAREIDTVAALTADSPVQQQRIRQLRPLVQREVTGTGSAVLLPRSPGRSAVRVVLPARGGSVVEEIRSLTAALRAEERRLLTVRRADAAAATRTARSTLVVAGLIAMLLAAVAAAGIPRSTTGPPHRAVAGPRGPADVRTVAAGTEDGGAGVRGIDDLVTVATSTAQQIHLLALDATIGAARAGAATAVEGHVREAPTATEDIARCGQGIPADPGAAVAAVGELSGIVARISERQSPPIASLVGVGPAPGAVGVPGTVARGADEADLRTGTAAKTPTATLVEATSFAAARSRAHGPTTALWHAVHLHRPFGTVDGPCQLAVCGSLVRVTPEQRWPVAARDVCPACATLAH